LAVSRPRLFFADYVSLYSTSLQGHAHYNLPAGGLEPGETLAEAALREANPVPMQTGQIYQLAEAERTRMMWDIRNFICQWSPQK
jgi:hypothetical protein